jgi:hypothetical protein
MGADLRKAAISEMVQSVYPGAKLLSVQPLAPDATAGDAAEETGKAAGYGEPLLLRIATEDRHEQALVLHTASANDFGHDRRADRAGGILLAFDTFGKIPGHVRALDVGAVHKSGHLVSLRDAGELYLLTSYAPGTVYVEDLRRIAHGEQAEPLDVARAEALARYLVELHRTPGKRPAAYVRAIRDLVGHGEGVFGIIDGYGPETPAAPPARLQAIERRLLDWRWRLRNCSSRLRRTHGDFHPFNVVFQEGTRFTCLDASRGCEGDPADDVAAMAINYVFFALEKPGAWPTGLRRLWNTFWHTYLDGSGDEEILDVVAPFLAWRGLVVSNPLFYPKLAARDRDAMLGFAERALDGWRFDPASADALFR